MNFFKREPYPSFPKEWDDPEKTLYREFYLTNAVDFEILLNLVKDHMSDKGNCGVTRYRLINLLVACRSRAYYLMYQKRKHPCTWRLRWWYRLAKQYYHRRLRTRTYLNDLEISRTAQSFTRNLQKSEKATIA